MQGVFFRLRSRPNPGTARPRRTVLTVNGLEDRTVLSPLASPTGLTAWAGSSSKGVVVPVQWNPVAGADEYRLEASRDGGGWAQVPAHTGGEAIHGGVTKGTLVLFIPGASGTYSFRVHAAGGGEVSGPSAAASTRVFLFPQQMNHAPRALQDYATTTPGKSVVIPVLANDRDLEGDPMKLNGVGKPAHGTAEVVGNQVRYTPKPGFVGSDLFSYTVSDSPNRQATTMVRVDVGAAVAGLPVVSVRALTAAITEPKLGAAGKAGVFRFTRTGDLSKPLAVSVDWGGTAKFGQDYQPVKWTVTFAAGAATVNVKVVANADLWRDASDTVTAEIRSGAGYAVDPTKSVDVITIKDNYNPKLSDPTV